MEENHLPSDFIQNVTVLQNGTLFHGEDPRILATSYMMYKVGEFVTIMEAIEKRKNYLLPKRHYFFNGKKYPRS